MKKNIVLTYFGLLLLILGGILLIIFSPLLNFAVGWIIGWLISKTFATTFISGVALFGLHINTTQIPMFCGILGCISSFFRDGDNLPSFHYSDKDEEE